MGYLHFQIGIVTVNQYLDYVQNNSFSIDVYDGPSAKYERLSYWHGRTNFHPYHFDALTSSRNVIFVNYTAHGGAIDLHMDVMFYLCGGKVDVELKIGSPIIDRNTTFEVPQLLECTWIIEKPADVSYGFLQFYFLSVPNCHTLSVKTDKGRLISVHIGQTSNSNSSSDNTDTLDEFAIARQMFHKRNDDPDGLTSETNGYKANLTGNFTVANPIHEINICNSSIKGVMFNGSDINLTYSMLFPQKKFGFTAFFQFLHLPTPVIKTPPANNPIRTWFINYGALVFCSIGIIIGSIVMYCQAKWCSRRSKRSTYVYANANHNGNVFQSPMQRSNNAQSNSRAFRPNYGNEQLLELKETQFSISDIEEETEVTDGTRNHQLVTNEKRKKCSHHRQDTMHRITTQSTLMYSSTNNETLTGSDSKFRKPSLI